MGGKDADRALHVRGADPPVPVRVVPLEPLHAHDAARLHIEGQPGTFLSELGPGILEIVYEKLPRTDAGFGFAAVSPACRDGRPVVIGFVSAATSVGGLFFQTATARAGKLMPRLATRGIRRPALFGRMVQTALYPFTGTESNAHAEQGLRSAELLSIMVEPHWRGRGVGALLLDALITECRARDVSHLDVTVDAGNVGARRFYERHGFREQRAFRLYGRSMLLYGREI